MMMVFVAIALLWLACSCALLALAYRAAMSVRWREPALNAPVLILESDDWGYGSVGQTRALDRIAEVLGTYRDRNGRHPVMTLGIVLAGPDTERMRAERCSTYHRITLADPPLAGVRDAISRGTERGVFSLQLHGLEHYWPECLMREAATNVEIRNWLVSPGCPATEALPPRLQSRWIDATTLPSKPLPISDIGAAAEEESRVFATTFGIRPEVAVPPTFVWTKDVESAWAAAGVRVVVTPGKRYESRDREGRPVASDVEHYNGATTPDGLSYIVRDSYFEPSLGHTHHGALRALAKNSKLGRPTLLEIHRMNFIGDEVATDRALDEVSKLLTAACAEFPSVRFMSTAELVMHYRDASDLITSHLGARVHVLLLRLKEISRLRKLAWATGVMLIAWLAYLATSPRVRGSRQW